MREKEGGREGGMEGGRGQKRGARSFSDSSILFKRSEKSFLTEMICTHGNNRPLRLLKEGGREGGRAGGVKIT